MKSRKLWVKVSKTYGFYMDARVAKRRAQRVADKEAEQDMEGIRQDEEHAR